MQEGDFFVHDISLGFHGGKVGIPIVHFLGPQKNVLLIGILKDKI